MSITFDLARKEADTQYGFVVRHLESDHAVNVSNRNCGLILERLGLDPMESMNGGDMPAGDFLGRCLVANVGRDDSGDAPAHYSSTWVDGGLRDGYFEDTMERLAALSTEASERGLLIAWG